MPELPEAERTRRLIEQVAVGRRIARARCANDPIVFVDGPVRTRRALAGRTVLAARRRGKQIWCELDARPFPLFHLGMTGSFRSPDAERLVLQAGPKREAPAWPPRFTKLHLWLEDGGELVMTNARRLGRIRLREDPEREPPIGKLGFDALLDPPAPSRFAALLRARRGPVKAVLMDQSFAAGVGNWIADEVLYQARIDPRRRASTLAEAEARLVRAKLIAVVRRAVEVNAEKSRFPRTWLFHRRWGKTAGARTVRGETIEFVTVGGRTTAWVPARQQ